VVTTAWWVKINWEQCGRLDGASDDPYMQRQMNRIVLALLALFAGIAAQVSPAEARVRGATEIGATLGQRAAARVASAVEVAAAFRAPPRAEGYADDKADQPLLRVHRFAPSVRIGSDRARE
jgi:hypothetical protein